MDNAYQAGETLGQNTIGDLNNLMQNYDPNLSTPNNYPNQDPSHYDQQNPGVMDLLIEDAQQLSSEDPLLADILSSTDTSQTITLDPNDPLFNELFFQQSQLGHYLSDKNSFCLTGECVDASYSPNDEFEAVGAALAVIGEGVSDFGLFNQIFPGQAMGCSRNILDFKDCCVESGWGLNLYLASCNHEENQLGLAREQNRTIKVGDYCAESLLGVCYRTKQVYCVFKSKMARIVQQQGHYQQLRLGFGQAEEANCSGLSLQQFEQINFEQVELSEIYPDLKSQIELPSQTTLSTTVISEVRDAVF